MVKGYVSGKIHFRFVDGVDKQQSIATNSASPHVVVDAEGEASQNEILWTDCDDVGSNRRVLICYQWMRCSSEEVQIDVTWNNEEVRVAEYHSES